MELRKLKGGLKHKYLREHRREILGYLSMHGERKTLEKYCMRVDTLERLVNDRDAERNERVSDVERVLLKVEILQENVSQLNRDMRALETNYNVPVEQLADSIRDNIVIPLLRLAQRPYGLKFQSEENLLEVGDLLRQVERERS